MRIKHDSQSSVISTAWRSAAEEYVEAGLLSMANSGKDTNGMYGICSSVLHLFKIYTTN